MVLLLLMLKPLLVPSILDRDVKIGIVSLLCCALLPFVRCDVVGVVGVGSMWPAAPPGNIPTRHIPLTLPVSAQTGRHDSLNSYRYVLIIGFDDDSSTTTTTTTTMMATCAYLITAAQEREYDGVGGGGARGRSLL